MPVPRPTSPRTSIRLGGTTLVQPMSSEGGAPRRAGQTGTVIDTDYLGRDALAAYAPVNLPGLHWSIVAKIDTDEAFAPVSAFTKKLVLSTAVIIFLVCLASMFLARMFVRPIHRLEAGAQRISAGDYDTMLPVVTRDEFGDLTTSFNEMSRNLRVKDDLMTEQRKENDRLLLSLMPEAVAERYRQGEETSPGITAMSPSSSPTSSGSMSSPRNCPARICSRWSTTGAAVRRRGRGTGCGAGPHHA